MADEYVELADLCEAYYAAEELHNGEKIPQVEFVEKFTSLLLSASDEQLLWIADVLSKHRGG